MTGRQKILDTILSDYQSQSEEIIKKATESASQILKSADDSVKKELARSVAETEKEIERRTQSADSSAALSKRNILLAVRSEEIKKTVDGIVDYLVNLGDNDYFDFLYRCAAEFKGQKGSIRLNEKDRQRLPADFLDKMAAAGVSATLDEDCADIVGGFILKCGDIDLSADFNALVNSKREQLEDFINSRLFAE